jgi:ACS family hexuronate transporter-like MFS transporter
MTIRPSEPAAVTENKSGDEFVDGFNRYRWIICALIFFATTINYIDRQILSLLKPMLDEQLKWSNEQFGYVNSAFQGAYGIGLLTFGWFVDKYGTKLGYAVSIVAWSLSAIAHAAVGSVGGFINVRIALGLSEGGNFPSAIKAVALWFPKGERALATSIFNSGTNVGPIIAPILVPAIALNWGWHWAFILAGLAGFVWLAFWIPLYREPGKVGDPSLIDPGSAGVSPTRSSVAWNINAPAGRRRSQGGQLDDDIKLRWSSLLKYRQTWSFIFAKFMTDPVWWFFLIWLPDYFKKTRGLDIKQSWIHLVTIYFTITVLSILGGWITGHLTRLGWSVTRARKTGMFIFACLVLPIFAVTKVGDWSAVLLIGLAGAAHQAWSANLYTTVSDMFPNQAVASVVGLGGLAGATGGMLFPVYCGKILDRFSAAGNITAGYAILFSSCAFAYLVTFAVHHLLAPRFVQLDFERNRL